jgi:multidrug efflux pump subunit AcrA (membrane-fusion protein)
VVAAGMISRTSDTSRAQAWSDARSLPTVHLIPVRGADANGQLELPGTMAAWNTAHIFARVPGYVRSWDRDIGAAVGLGTPLGRIDTPELDQQIVAARASLARARAGAGLAQHGGPLERPVDRSFGVATGGGREERQSGRAGGDGTRR